MNPALLTALRLARHPVNDLERVEFGQQLLPHLCIGENVDTGALRILADRVEWLEGEAEQCRVMLHDVAAGRVDSRVRQERDELAAKVSELEHQCAEFEDKVREGDRFVLEEHVASWTRLRQHLGEDDRGESLVERIEGVMLERGLLRRQLAEAREMRTTLRAHAAAQVDHLQGEVLVAQDKCSSLMMEVDALQARVNRAEERANHAGLQAIALAGELAEARAENGRQAATIAAMRASAALIDQLTMNAMMRHPARIETPHTGRDYRHVFDEWMASQPADVTLAPVVLYKGQVVKLRAGETMDQAMNRVTAVAPPPLRLEVGKTYVRRDGGREVIVLDRGDTFEYRFQSASNATFRPDGTFGGPNAHPADLVALAPAVDPASLHS